MKTENELIAEFYATKKQVNDFDRIEYLLIGTPKGFNGSWFEVGNMRFHESWDWLMPVVEKIINIKGESSIAFCTPIESTYKAVIDFIKHYNEE